MSNARDQDRFFGWLADALRDYAICRLDREGRIESWNSAAERVYGFAADEALGLAHACLFPLEDRNAARPQAALDAALKSGRFEEEGWQVRKNGSRFWSISTVEVAPDGSGFVWITRDASQERAAQQALVESERNFRLLVDGVTDQAICLLDLGGVVTNWNRGAERIVGYRAGEIVGRHFEVFHNAEEREAGAPTRALETARREGHFESEGWRIRKDGSRFWASVALDLVKDEAGRPVGFSQITRDISQRRAAEDALAESELQFRFLVSRVVDYGLYTLDPGGAIISWNPGAERIKGYAAEDIVGQHFSRFYTDTDRAAGVPARALEAAAEAGRYEAEGWRVRRDGSLFWASVIIEAQREDDGRLVGFAKITRDITERRNAQIELQRANDRLGQAQKMEALGKLTGGVAHDFNNLLMVVSGHAHLLRNRVGEDPRARRALDAIETAAKRGEDLTRHLLAFSRRQRLQPEQVALSSREDALRELLAASLPGAIRLGFALPSDVWPLNVDLNELELALLNLAVNARDAMPNGGELMVSARNIFLESGEADEGLTGEFVAVDIADSGSGIPDDILPHIFDPFFTTKDVDKGTGLGLSQVYGFAQQSGGQVTVQSRLGKGSTFTLYLPRSTSDAPAAAPEERVESVPGAHILVVEDNPQVAEVAAGMLEQLGHRVEVVGDAQSALGALQGEHHPDLVFSDIVMAGEMDGVALARRLRDEAPDLPVLLATGYSSAAETLGGEFPILRKPYRLAELSRAVGALLARAREGGGNLVRLDAHRRIGKRGAPA